MRDEWEGQGQVKSALTFILKGLDFQLQDMVIKSEGGCLDCVISLTDAHRPGDSVMVIDHSSHMSSFALLAYPVRSEISLHFIKFRKMF